MTAVRQADSRDLETVAGLLTSCALSTDGIVEAMGNIVVAEQDGHVVGCAALTLHGGHGLVRSVAVAPGCRHQGIARAMIESLLARARAAGLPDVWLLTETAADCFARMGFRRVDREEMPPPLAESSMVRDICPTSAVVMSRTP